MNKNGISLILKRSAMILSIALIVLGATYIVKTDFLETYNKTSNTDNLQTKLSKKSIKTKNGSNTKTEKTAYLTFDDGPSSNVTPYILDTLKTYDVKATFFVTGKNSIINKLTLSKEAQSGNSIGIKSFDNNITKIYSSPTEYINDINECRDILRAILGDGKFNMKLIRFPGGSTMVSKNFKKSIKKAGYNFVDWDIDSKDALRTKQKLPNDIVNSVKSSYKNNDKIIILMHDSSSNEATLQALPEIIQFLKSQNYVFKTLK
ncbi:xylanase deacetylase [Clostridium acetobutylicum]|nr:xylanase deacetylase [Clostridium acetobutylicum]